MQSQNIDIPIIGGLLDILSNVLTQTVAALQSTIAGLTDADVGDLLLEANAEQLTRILDVAHDADLARGLDTLTALNAATCSPAPASTTPRRSTTSRLCSPTSTSPSSAAAWARCCLANLATCSRSPTRHSSPRCSAAA